MKNKLIDNTRVLTALVLSGMSNAGCAQPPAEAAAVPKPHIMADGYYVREPADRAWRLQFAGTIPVAGGYVVVHDARGKLIHHGAVPGGEYSVEKPFVVPIARDGVTGDYRIVLIGHQDFYLNLTMPLTDLPFEVYGGKSFSLGHNNFAYFKVGPNSAQMTLAAYTTNLQVLDEKGAVVADTKKERIPVEKNEALGFHRLDVAIDVALKPGVLYVIKPQAMYFRSRQSWFLTFDPAKWFEPSPTLDEVKWWTLVKL